MKSVELYAEGGLRQYALVMDKGDEAVGAITDFARAERITGASLTAVGACSEATLGYFDPEINDYLSTVFTEQMEILSLLGDIATKDDQPALHAHIVLGRRDSSAIGGHLQHLKVFPTLEIILSETPRHLRKRVDPSTGLALIALDATDR
jgi:predicted DNA-binding protein with PD1-like motif